MIDHVVKGLACQGHVEARHVGKVGSAETAGIMGLREEHLLGRPGGRSPLMNTTLKGPQLTVGEPTRVALLEPGEGSSPKRVGNFGPFFSWTSR